MCSFSYHRLRDGPVCPMVVTALSATRTPATWCHDSPARHMDKQRWGVGDSNAVPCTVPDVCVCVKRQEHFMVYGAIGVCEYSDSTSRNQYVEAFLLLWGDGTLPRVVDLRGRKKLIYIVPLSSYKQVFNNSQKVLPSQKTT